MAARSSRTPPPTRRSSCDRDSRRLQGCAAPQAGGQSGGITPLRDPARGPKKTHRVGLASVQFTRSTFAEATAGRESLQPSALRARCTRKPTGAFGRRQARIGDNVSQIATIAFAAAFAGEFRSTQKRTEGGGSFVRPPDRPPPKRLPVGGPTTTGAPSSVHTGQYGPVIVPSSGNRFRKSALCEGSLSHSMNLRLNACASRKNRTMSSPSRVRFRPPPRLTFRFRVGPPGRASS